MCYTVFTSRTFRFDRSFSPFTDGPHLRLTIISIIPPSPPPHACVTEEGESLEAAGLREVREETGLEVDHLAEDGPCQVLGLWESLYPPVLHLGQPKRHHVVVYYHLRLRLTTSDLQQRLKVSVCVT